MGLWWYLVQLLLSVLLAAQLILCARTQVPQSVGLLLCHVDLVPQLLLQRHLLHLHRAMLLLSDLKPLHERGVRRGVGVEKGT